MARQERFPELLEMSAVDVSRGIGRGDFSTAEVSEYFLARIERVNPALQAFVSVFEAPGRMTSPNGAPSVLRGVPVGIKDLNAVRWSRARYGSRLFRHVVTPSDDSVVRRVRAGGMRILGKLAVSELGALPVTEPLIHPPTRNPWDQARSPGGSSGGSAAAVAAGLVPLAHGADGAGSIRIPAAHCGVVGFKPSRGRSPNPHRGNDPRGMASHGVLARSVVDAAAFADVLDESTEPALAPRISAPLTRRLRIRVCCESPACAVDPEIAAAVSRVARVLEADGHEVVPGDWFPCALSEVLPVFCSLVSELPIPSPLDRRLEPVTRFLRNVGARTSRSDADAAFDDLCDRAERWVMGADAVLSPTVCRTAPKIGAYGKLPPMESFLMMAEYGAFTVPANLGGLPSISVPVALSSARLPIGVQITAARGADLVALSLARSIESACGFTKYLHANMLAQ